MILTCATIEETLYIARFDGGGLDDTQISAQVQALLLQDICLNGFRISVATDQDEVFLMGRVTSSESERQQAISVASETEGVIGVQNYLKAGRTRKATLEQP